MLSVFNDSSPAISLGSIAIGLKLRCKNSSYLSWPIWGDIYFILLSYSQSLLRCLSWNIQLGICYSLLSPNPNYLRFVKLQKLSGSYWSLLLSNSSFYSFVSSPNAIGKLFIPFFLKFSSTKFDKSAQSLARDAFTMAFFKFYSYRYFSYLACFYFSYIYFIFCSWSSSYCFFLNSYFYKVFFSKASSTI